VVETRVCLADCVQVMTGCTLGNKAMWLRDDIGRYALTLYDRDTKDGVRVFLDVTKIDRDRRPELHAFHTRTRDPRVLTDTAIRKESGRRVVSQFLQVKRGCLGYERVKVLLPTKAPMLPSVPCARCGEPYLRADGDGDLCLACQGRGYYDVVPGSIEPAATVAAGRSRRPCTP
jgi:formylmethanofuran dehydrogenase subunit E